jgi:hypothetical protein
MTGFEQAGKATLARKAWFDRRPILARVVNSRKREVGNLYS